MTRRLLLLLTAALLACGGAPPTADSTRLISLSPAITETLAALGARDRLVGRSDWCTEPPEVRDLPALGSVLTPNLEQIAALLPATVLVDGSLSGQADKIRGLAPVEVLPWLTAGEVAASVRRLGTLSDRADAAEALARRFDALDRPADGPPVLVVMDGDLREVWYLKRNSLHGAVLHAAGARNAIDRDEHGAPALSTEALLRLDPPTLIVLVPRTLDDAGRAERIAAWSKLPLAAAKNGRIGIVAGPLVMSTGPAVLDLADALRAELARLTPIPPG